MNNVLDEAIAGNGLVAAFQRVVALPTGEVVGYEALARWPATTSMAPLDIITHAIATGRLNTLDRACIRAAAHGALQGKSTPGMLLLVNSEPGTACGDLLEDEDIMRAVEVFHLVVEITERGLLQNPRALMRKVSALRSLGIAVALDDMGAHPDSVALLDVVSPDIVKLDLGLVQHHPDRVQAQTVEAILDYRDRTGAVICAEGIETEEHLHKALRCGATLGQGYLFGAPGELSVRSEAFPRTVRHARSDADANPSIFDTAAAGLVTQTIDRPALIELLGHIQHRAATAETAPIVLASLGRDAVAEHTLMKYRCLAKKSPFVGVFGRDVPHGLGHRARKLRVDADDPLAHEISIVALGPDTALALVARERDPQAAAGGPAARLYDVVFTADRERTAAVVRSLLDRPHQSSRAS